MLIKLKVSDLPKIFGSKEFRIQKDHLIKNLLYDSRRIFLAKEGVFFALAAKKDGHEFIGECQNLGVQTFIIKRDFSKLKKEFPKANFIKVDDPLVALQELAVKCRKRFKSKEVIGITGSNGKTIVKEWLWNILSIGFEVYKSPKSFNSQLGVAISIWEKEPTASIDIIEAGISEKGEMKSLQRIIQPSLGVLTNIGAAHAEGFKSWKEKLQEKLLLFSDSKKIIFRGDTDYSNELRQIIPSGKLVSWGAGKENDYVVKYLNPTNGKSTISINSKKFEFHFSDSGSLENITHAIVCALELNMTTAQIQMALEGISRVSLRMDLKKGRSGSWIINDSYNLDLKGFKLGIEALLSQTHTKDKSLIMTDFPSKKHPANLYPEISRIVNQSDLKTFVGIGPELSANKKLFKAGKKFFIKSPRDFKSSVGFDHFKEETVLVTGARKFSLEKLMPYLEERIHGTVMEIDLDAIAHNLNIFKQLSPNSKLMVMVKGSGYGGGLVELGKFLERMKVDYFGVAYADEGIELRKSGISTPIMVMNSRQESLDMVLDHDMEPEIFDWEGLEFIKNYKKQTKRNPGIHINIDTGMHRLGFELEEVSKLSSFLVKEKIKVVSIFSHLSSSDVPKEKEFTKNQIKSFVKAGNKIRKIIGSEVPLHICNTSGIINFPEGQLDMVRLGIGLYGIDPSNKIENRLLSPVFLKTEISQVKKLKKGDSVGYSRKGQMKQNGYIATLPIGYADGIPRIMGNGKSRVIIEGQPFPIIGNVCMDMIMVDLGKNYFPQGPEVEIFGKDIGIREYAEIQNTIPYEVLTQVGQRVKRIYISGH